MSKVFNVTGDCKSEIHYMVNIDDRLKKIKTLVDKGEYFSINRARQYGKTTTLRYLGRFLQNEYLVIDLDFQTFGDAKFKNENVFSLAFSKAFLRTLKRNKVAFTEEAIEKMDDLGSAIKEDRKSFELLELFEAISDICAVLDRPVVLMIDEVDSSTNNRVFLDFLAQLRAYYIDRDRTATFKSVILAGVHDIKNLKLKLRPEDDHKTNSPWNIAVKFTVDMSFSVEDISGMLKDYENDHHTGMDILTMANLLYDYTSGYPFLVSALCKIIDEDLAGNENYPDKNSAWSKNGFLDAERILLTEKNTLFESLTNKLYDFPELKEMVNALLFTGKSIGYNPDNQAIDLAIMFGFVRNQSSNVVIANRIFETRLYNLFLSSSEFQNTDIYKAALQDKSQFIVNGHLYMRLVMEKFTTHFDDLYGDRNEIFLENDGRRYFLLYIRPIINGTGNYYIESQTRDLNRTDVIVDYNGEQYIIEMKIWRGEEYNRRGIEQLVKYLDKYHQTRGYMLSFNFNKNKQIGVNEIVIGDKIVIEAVV